jgi:hypothetical protein
VVTVTRIDRLAPSTFDLFEIVKRIVDAKAQFRSLAEPWADTGTSTGRLMIAVLGGLADVERGFIPHLHRRGQKPRQGPRAADGPPLRHSPRRSKKRPAAAARKALRSTNSPAAIMSAYPPFAAPRGQPHDRKFGAILTHGAKEAGALPRSGFITSYCRARRFAAIYSSNASREYGFSASFRPASSASGGCGFCSQNIC